jgi:hypothetical protein
MQRINCRICEYYFVTWEHNRPHGCKAYGFKSPYMPYQVVYRTTGQDCRFFTPKPRPAST